LFASVAASMEITGGQVKSDLNNLDSPFLEYQAI
jgi:hypothetical protein